MPTTAKDNTCNKIPTLDVNSKVKYINKNKSYGVPILESILHPNQLARPKRWIHEAHLIVSRAVKKNIKVLCIDFEKAYDSVKHGLIDDVIFQITESEYWVHVIGLFLVLTTVIMNSLAQTELYLP